MSADQDQIPTHKKKYIAFNLQKKKTMLHVWNSVVMFNDPFSDTFSIEQAPHLTEQLTLASVYDILLLYDFGSSPNCCFSTQKRERERERERENLRPTLIFCYFMESEELKYFILLQSSKNSYS